MMSARTSLLVIGTALGCLVCVLLAAVLGLSGYAYYQNATNQSVDRIAYVDNDLNIQVVDAQGGHRIALTADAADSNQRLYMFPTWSPDSHSVAFVGVDGDLNQPQGALDVAPAMGGNLTTIFSSTAQLPFYIYWSPDNRRIGFLTQAENETALMLAYVDGQEQARKLEAGSPIYWAWSPDGLTLLTHSGGSRRDSQDAELAFLRWQDGQGAHKFSDQPGTFLAPHFSPDGSAILYASAEPDSDGLFLADTQGQHPKSILRYSGTIAFAWSPDGKKIASIVTPAGSSLPANGPIVLLDADGSNRKQITDEEALAFYWSPDSQQIAYLTIAAPGQRSGCRNCKPIRGLSAPLAQDPGLQLRWRVVNSTGGPARTLSTFTPTENFISILPFFDQYARSLTFWSPDSKHFVYTQGETESGGSVWVVDLNAQTESHKVGDGTLAVWSWK